MAQPFYRNSENVAARSRAFGQADRGFVTRLAATQVERDARLLDTVMRQPVGRDARLLSDILDEMSRVMPPSEVAAASRWIPAAARVFPWAKAVDLMRAALTLYRLGLNPAMDSRQNIRGWQLVHKYCLGANGQPGSGDVWTNFDPGVEDWCTIGANTGPPPGSIGSSLSVADWKYVGPSIFGEDGLQISGWSAVSGQALDTTNPARLPPASPQGGQAASPEPEDLVGRSQVDLGKLVSVVPFLAWKYPLGGKALSPAESTRLDSLVDRQALPDPWLGREVGPEVSPRPKSRVEASPWAGLLRSLEAFRLLNPDPAPQPEVRLLSDPGPDPWTPPGVWPYQTTGPSLEITPPGQPPIILEPHRFGKPPGRQSKLRPRYGGLIRLLIYSTYLGGFIRAVFQSVPPACRSPAHGGKRRYDSMLEDIRRCWDQISWGEVAVRIGEVLLKYAAEGAAIHAINQRFPWGGTGWGASGLGTATKLYHGSAGLDVSGPYKGEYADPFGGLSAVIADANKAVFGH